MECEQHSPTPIPPQGETPRHLDTPRRPRSRPRHRPKHQSPVPPTVIVIRRPFTTPQVLTVQDVDSLVSRLSRPTTTQGRRAVQWSGPRRQYEQDFQAQSALHPMETYRRKYEEMHPRVPNTWREMTPGQLQGIVKRLSKATQSTASRAEAQIYQRRVIERYKRISVANDIGLTPTPPSGEVTPTSTEANPNTPVYRAKSPLSFHKQTLINNRDYPHAWMQN